MFKLKDYIFTPKDLLDLPRKASQMSRRSRLGIVILVGVGFILKLFLNFQMESIIFWLFFISLFYWKLDSRISIGFALACLVTIPFLLILFNQNILLLGDIWAEQVAVWAYFFLVIGVVKQVWEFKVVKPVCR